MAFEDFLKADIYPGFNWADHVNSYLDLKGNSSYDVLTVKYEDLQSEPFETMLEVRAGFAVVDKEMCICLFGGVVVSCHIPVVIDP